MRKRFSYIALVFSQLFKISSEKAQSKSQPTGVWSYYISCSNESKSVTYGFVPLNF